MKETLRMVRNEELSSLNNGHIVFENREDAGRHLAQALKEYRETPVVVLAIPNGGVPVAVEVAFTMNQVEMDMIICRKIPLPLTPEGGFGACADDGTIILNEEVVQRVGLSRAQIEQEASKVRAEITRRSLLHTRNRPIVRVAGKTVIIVDDGFASGITMRAAVESIRHRRPAEVIAAAPCASAPAIAYLEQYADRVVSIGVSTGPKFAVADYYNCWFDLSDQDVQYYMRKWRMRRFQQEK